MTAKHWTISTVKKFFQKVKSAKDAIDGFLTAFKWILTISGALYTYYSAKTMMNNSTEIQHKADTIKQVIKENKLKEDTIKIAKTICSKALDDNMDTASKYKKIAKVLYVKPIEVLGFRKDSNNIKIINKLRKR